MLYLHQEDRAAWSDLVADLQLIAAETEDPKKVWESWTEWENSVVNERNETSFSEWMCLDNSWTERDGHLFQVMETLFRVVLRSVELEKRLAKSSKLICSMKESLKGLSPCSRL